MWCSFCCFQIFCFWETFLLLRNIFVFHFWNCFGSCHVYSKTNAYLASEGDKVPFSSLFRNFWNILCWTLVIFWGFNRIVLETYFSPKLRGNVVYSSKLISVKNTIYEHYIYSNLFLNKCLLIPKSLWPLVYDPHIKGQVLQQKQNDCLVETNKKKCFLCLFSL